MGLVRKSRYRVPHAGAIRERDGPLRPRAAGYGLADLDDSFNRGDYQRVYIETLHNKYASTKPQVDTSQYEAFGRYYHAYVQSRLHEDNAAYLQQMEEEKAHITWKKILNVIDLLEQRE